MADRSERPVTFGVVSLVVACAMTATPLVGAYVTLQSRVASLEKSVELRGSQLDRIETDVKEILRRMPR